MNENKTEADGDRDLVRDAYAWEVAEFVRGCMRAAVGDRAMDGRFDAMKAFDRMGEIWRNAERAGMRDLVESTVKALRGSDDALQLAPGIVEAARAGTLLVVEMSSPDEEERTLMRGREREFRKAIGRVGTRSRASPDRGRGRPRKDG